jgi:hypothetical protein
MTFSLAVLSITKLSTMTRSIKNSITTPSIITLIKMILSITKLINIILSIMTPITMTLIKMTLSIEHNKAKQKLSLFRVSWRLQGPVLSTSYGANEYLTVFVISIHFHPSPILLAYYYPY